MPQTVLCAITFFAFVKVEIGPTRFDEVVFRIFDNILKPLFALTDNLTEDQVTDVLLNLHNINVSYERKKKIV